MTGVKLVLTRGAKRPDNFFKKETDESSDASDVDSAEEVVPESEYSSSDEEVKKFKAMGGYFCVVDTIRRSSQREQLSHILKSVRYIVNRCMQ